MKNTFVKKLSVIILAFTLLASMAMFFNEHSTVKADSVYTILFDGTSLGKGTFEREIVAGGTLLPNNIPSVENEGSYMFRWIGVDMENGITNVNENKIFILMRVANPEYLRTVTFVFTDGTTQTMQVVSGENITDPPVPENMSFGERAKYSIDLNNITENLEVEVTIDPTVKYIIIAGCGALLVASLIVIMILALRFGDKQVEEYNETFENELNSEEKVDDKIETNEDKQKEVSSKSKKNKK